MSNNSSEYGPGFVEPEIIMAEEIGRFIFQEIDRDNVGTEVTPELPSENYD